MSHPAGVVVGPLIARRVALDTTGPSGASMHHAAPPAREKLVTFAFSLAVCLRTVQATIFPLDSPGSYGSIVAMDNKNVAELARPYSQTAYGPNIYSRRCFLIFT